MVSRHSMRTAAQTAVRRSALAALGVLGGCLAPTGSPPGTALAQPSTAWRTLFAIAGARVAIPDRAGMPLLQMPAPYARLVSPVSAVSSGHDYYVADAGASRIYRYDPALDMMTVLDAVPARLDTRLAVAPDDTVLVVEPAARRVVRYTRSGQLVAAYADAPNMARPVSAAWDEDGGRLIVADSVYRHLVAFHPAGRASYIVPMRGDERNSVRSIGAVAVGKSAIHVADPVCRCVLVVARDGTIAYGYGHNAIIQPAAVALDARGRAYVADIGAAAIRVYEGVREVIRVDAAALGLAQVSDVSIDRDLLTVTDSTTARVAVVRVPPSSEGRP